MEVKLNCWEYMKCGRESGGVQAVELGVCPATTDERHDGEHSGRNAGRICWRVAGTFCDGKIQGHFVEKIMNCVKCPFYLYVKNQEKSF